MKKQSKVAFEIMSGKEKKEIRKRFLKYVLPIIMPVYLLIFYLTIFVSKNSGNGVLWVISSQMPLSIIVIVLAIALIPFLWFISRNEIKSKVYDEMVKNISKAFVDKMLVPGVPIEVGLIKARGAIYGEFVLDLQYEDADFYAVLGEKDNLILIYAILKGSKKKRNVDVISKGDFSEYYQLLETSE